MPNWCSNTIELRHEDPAMIQRAVEAFKQGKFCNEFIPVPQQLKDTYSGSSSDAYEQELNEFKIKLNEKYFGSANWYDFCVNRWGTKWDVGDAESINTVDDNHMVAYFDSAWSPPIGVYEELEMLGYDVEAWYYEPGMAFVGKWHNGEDFCIEYGGYTSDNVRDAIGEELDDMFCISENMAEWEEENE